ncbi:MAG: GNAT family N-acetyltransferase [Lachnospiraceae bacterium]|nr:GNAT family N-acetyltransferase [Lachnospiraceae bacterium]
MDLKIIEYYESADKEHWLAEIGRSDWPAGQLLHKLISEDGFKKLCGENARILLLTDGDKLVSYCTYVFQDEIDDPEITPWMGFVYTFPEYRGKRMFGNLVERVCELARGDGHKILYVSTEEVGLYEKYGFSYWKTMPSIYGWQSRVYRQDI